MEDGECDVIASASDGVAVSCDGATGASLSIAGCSSPPASQSPADPRGSQGTGQGEVEGDVGCASCNICFDS